jgi:hypothetical protein
LSGRCHDAIYSAYLILSRQNPDRFSIYALTIIKKILEIFGKMKKNLKVFSGVRSFEFLVISFKINVLSRISDFMERGKEKCEVD